MIGHDHRLYNEKVTTPSGRVIPVIDAGTDARHIGYATLTFDNDNNVKCNSKLISLANIKPSKKYLDMLDETIANAVLATTQTYVEALKKENKFDLEAQKAAFQQTYDAVMKVLTSEAMKYITESVGDLETYVTNKIEAEVNLTKN